MMLTIVKLVITVIMTAGKISVMSVRMMMVSDDGDADDCNACRTDDDDGDEARPCSCVLRWRS